LIPGALGDAESVIRESFMGPLLDYPQYTRPEVIGDQRVPAVLLSGNHAAIDAWRKHAAVSRTLQRRPDLLDRADLDVETRRLIKELTVDFRKPRNEAP
ncbi:MAG: tRNA (guanosine(37)-N1)-methyltransferase TrmD, partial [Gammaproteobacteria bacterium]